MAYEAAKAAGIEPNGAADVGDMNDPNKITVVRWIMDNAHCGWLIGKGGSGIQNIEVRAYVGLTNDGMLRTGVMLPRMCHFPPPP